MTKKIFSILALLAMTVSGAWADGYYVVGNMNDWTVNSQYKLAVNPGNASEMMITLWFDAAAEFKVVYSADDAASTTWYPSGSGNNYYVNTEGRYTVYFRSDYGGGDDWHYKCIYLAWDPIVAAPTANANEWTFAMPGYDVEVGVVYDTELALSETDDNTAKLAEWDGYEADVTLTRTLQAGGWNTLALPFNVESATLTAINAKLALMSGSMTVKELTSSSFDGGTLTLNFGDATSMKAGTPYLVKVTTPVALAGMPFAAAEVSKTAVTVETTAVDFVPTLGLTEVTGDTKEILFLGTGNTLLYPETLPGNMKGFRAYFKLKGGAATAPALSFALNFGDGETTGISQIENGELRMENSVYDLQGRRVNSATQKGVYIVNGKKTVIK